MKFDKPLNQFIEEDITVRTVTPNIDEVNQRVSLEVKDVPAKQKVMYINAPKRNAICAKGKHHWIMTDNRKYLFSCTHCGFIKKAYPVTYEYKDFQLIHKETKEAI